MKEDKEHYKKGVDTAQKIVDLMEGKEGDHAQLEGELKNPEYDSLIEKLSDGDRLRRGLNEFERPEVRHEAFRFRRQVSRRSAVKRITDILTVAAAVTALVAGGWYFIGRGDRTDNISVARATDDVTLTLPDGSRVVLGKAADGNRIAELGNITLSLENGILVNEKRSSSGNVPAEANTGTIEVPRGSLFDVLLEDGTRVWINANSTFRYPIEFRGKERRVWLEGEAYFEVSPDAERPFIVETEDQTLNVLGTKFNIYAYPDAQSVLTTLVEGSVFVGANQTGIGTTLQPGQQARLMEDGYRIEDVDAIEISAWRNRMFIFNDNTLGMVFDKLSRWYDFEYVFEDPDLAEEVMMGIIPVDDDFNAVLEIINAAKVADIEAKGNVVTIKNK